MSKYTFDNFYIPTTAMQHLRNYIEHGTHPGNFLHAVLCNDLRGACTLGGNENLRNLPAFVAYLYTNETPLDCWGSPERVAAWIAEHAAQQTTQEP